MIRPKMEIWIKCLGNDFGSVWEGDIYMSVKWRQWADQVLKGGGEVLEAERSAGAKLLGPQEGPGLENHR